MTRKMHADEEDLDAGLVRRLSVRLAGRDGPTEPGGKEFDWLAVLAPAIPVEVPVPVAQGQPGDD